MNNFSSSILEAEYEVLIVERVGVMTTYFLNASNGAGVYIRNAILSQSTLVNLSRGGRISVSFTVRLFHPSTHMLNSQMKVQVSTTKQDLASLKKTIERKLFSDKVPLIRQVPLPISRFLSDILSKDSHVR